MTTMMRFEVLDKNYTIRNNTIDSADFEKSRNERTTTARQRDIPVIKASQPGGVRDLTTSLWAANLRVVTSSGHQSRVLKLDRYIGHSYIERCVNRHRLC